MIVRLIEPGAAGEAKHNSLAFGYVPFSGTEHIARFFSFYREWLDQRELVHSPESFPALGGAEYCGQLPGGPQFVNALISGRPRDGTIRIRAEYFHTRLGDAAEAVWGSCRYQIDARPVRSSTNAAYLMHRLRGPSIELRIGRAARASGRNTSCG